MPHASDSHPSVVITGASTGIGEGCAVELDRRGWRVFAGIRSDNTKASAPGDFFIEHSEHSPGVIHAAIGSPGLTAAPAIAELIVRMLGDAGLQRLTRQLAATVAAIGRHQSG